MSEDFEYIGDVVNGQREGWGRIVRIKDGSVVFIGDFRGDLPSGLCERWELPDGSGTYVGQMFGGFRHGLGTLFHEGNVVYEGFWYDDLPDLRGTYTAVDGFFEGEWRSGNRHGKGRFLFLDHPGPDGQQRRYEGDWHRDAPHGVGRYRCDLGADRTYNFVWGLDDASMSTSAAASGGPSEERIEVAQGTSSIISRSSWRRLVFQVMYLQSKFASAQAFRNAFSGSEGIANVYLVVWFILNIVITLLSKAMFTNFHFPYPMMLTAVHLGVTWLGSQAASSLRLFNSTTISPAQLRGLIIFSLVFTINIWLSNYALMVVSVSVHQVFRTTIPLFTMALSLVLYKEIYPLRMLPSVLLVIVGVCATVWGDLGMTIWGGIVVALGCAFSSLKGLMSQKAQIGAQGLETFDLLRAVCPMAVIELLICGCLNGEVGKLLHDKEFTGMTAWNLFLQGVLAFSLNFVSFKCAALKNPLTMNIAGNVKQVITPLVAIWLGLGGSITVALVTGLVLTFVGAIWYGNEASLRKQALAKAAAERASMMDQEKPQDTVQMVMADGNANGTSCALIQNPPTTSVTVGDILDRRIEMSGRSIAPKTIAAPGLAVEP